jgi:hypothetical protein
LLIESHSISTPNEHHCDQRNTKLNQQAIDEKNEWKTIYHYTPIQLSPSLSKNTHVGGGVVEKRKKEKRRGYKLQPPHAPRNMQQNNQRNEQRKE